MLLKSTVIAKLPDCSPGFPRSLVICATLIAAGQGCSLVSPLDQPNDGTSTNTTHSTGGSHSGSGGTTGSVDGGTTPVGNGGTVHSTGGSGGTVHSTGGSGGTVHSTGGSGNTAGRNTGGASAAGGQTSFGGDSAAGSPSGGSTAQCESFELLIDGDLENASGTTWTEVSTNNSALIEDSTNLNGFSPESGNQAAWLGGLPLEDSGLGQDVSVPTGTVQLTASGYYGITGTDTGTGDYAYVALFDSGGNPLGTFDSWYGSDTTLPWQYFTVTVDASLLAGTTVSYLVASTTDSVDNSNFFFDNLSLVATVCH